MTTTPEITALAQQLVAGFSARFSGVVPRCSEEAASVVPAVLAALLPQWRFAENSNLHTTAVESCQVLSEILNTIFERLEVTTQPERNRIRTVGFLNSLPQLQQQILADADAIVAGDPAARSISEVILTYPGWYATVAYRVANRLWRDGALLTARSISEYAHQTTGVDIHPGATIGQALCIDHGTGVVIGETTIIGDRVKIYQGVTLGGLTVNKAAQGSKRHPTIEDDVMIYANATILGGTTTIGARCTIGGNVWITSSVPPDSRVTHQGQLSTTTA